jgi:hypothetical protein
VSALPLLREDAEVLGAAEHRGRAAGFPAEPRSGEAGFRGATRSQDREPVITVVDGVVEGDTADIDAFINDNIVSSDCCVHHCVFDPYL